MSMTTQIKNRYLNVKLLAKLGNPKPNHKQILLMNSLLFTVDVVREIVFMENLTDREIGCLRLIAQGKTATEIAKILNLKKTTIDSHYKKIKRKTNSRTMPEAVFKSMCLGIFDIQNLRKKYP